MYSDRACAQQGYVQYVRSLLVRIDGCRKEGMEEERGCVGRRGRRKDLAETRVN